MLGRMGRLALVLGGMLALKVAARLFLIGAFTDAAIQFFAIVDAVVILVASPWTASSPKPVRAAIRQRAVKTTAFLTVGLWIMNLALQFPLLLNRSGDFLEAVLRLFATGLSNAVLAGPIGALAIWLLATAVTWVWLLLRTPAERKDKLPRTKGKTDNKERAREDQPNRNVPRPPRSPQLRVRKGSDR
jgi:hypothetical protein